MTEERGESIVDRLRQVGPAGIVLGVLVVGAIVAVVFAANSSVDEQATTSEPTAATVGGTTATTSSPASAVPPPPDTDSSTNQDHRVAASAFVECLQDLGLRVRLEGVTETDIVVAIRAGGRAIQGMNSADGLACAEEHVVETGLAVTTIEIERGGVPTTVGEGDTGATPTTVFESTDTTTVDRPSTDTTVP